MKHLKLLPFLLVLPVLLFPDNRKRIQSFNSFAVQFSGSYIVDSLAAFPLVITDPDHMTGEDILTLKRRGVTLLGYINIGEVETYRHYFQQLDTTLFLKKNPNWDDHYYVRANDPKWENFIVEKIAPPIIAKGFHGLFLDMVDVASPWLYPEFEPGMIEIIKRLRREHPEIIIVMNAGTFLATKVGSDIDAIVVESVFYTYDFQGKNYFPQTEPAIRSRVQELSVLKNSLDLPILTIDYIEPNDTLAARDAARASRSSGFIPFISRIALDTLITQPAL